MLARAQSNKHPFGKYLIFSLLPILVSVYPTIFHYGNNDNLVLFSSFLKTLMIMASVGILVYGVSIVIFRSPPVQSANAAFVFLIFFNTYGWLFHFILGLDRIRVSHSIILPLFIVIGLYTAWFITHLNDIPSRRIWTSLIGILGVLVIFNLIRTIPYQIQKANIQTQESQSVIVNSRAAVSTNQKHPDIYYLVFDEMAGFEAIRNYWQYTEIDQVVGNLQSHGFYVAEDSHSAYTYTFYEMASRLNFEYRPIRPKRPYYHFLEDLEAWADNRAFQDLESYGYITIAYDERRNSAFETASPLNVDYLFEKPVGNTLRGIGFFDQFGVFVGKNTMLQPLAVYFELNSPELELHRDMILFTTEKVASVDYPSPKFVLVHLMLPHVPFMFDAMGGLTAPESHHNWDKYFDNYLFTTRVMEEMIDNILSSADPENPPVIIIQSDHGARGLESGATTMLLENYPDEYKTLIINAMYLPGCPAAPFTQDMDPINTFPIVFNCYFNTNIPIQ
jgi:hypothetical protein